MKKDPTVFIKHILESIATMESYASGCTLEDFIGNPEKQDAVLWRFVVIGEAARNLPEDTRKLFSKAEWTKIIAMRNLLIHEYFGIDLNLVWSVLQKRIPELKEMLKKAVTA